MTSASQESLLSALIFAQLLGAGIERQVLVRSYAGHGHQVDVPRRLSEPVRILASEHDPRPLADQAEDMAHVIFLLQMENEARREQRQAQQQLRHTRRTGRRIKFSDDKPTDKRAAKRAEKKRLRRIACLTAQMLSEAQRARFAEEN